MHPDFISWVLLILVSTSSVAGAGSSSDEEENGPLQIVTTPSDDDGYITPNSPLVSPHEKSFKFDEDDDEGNDDTEYDFSGLSVWIFNKSAVDFSPSLSEYFTLNTISLTTNQDFNDLVKVMKGYGREQKQGGTSFSFGLYSPSKPGSRFRVNVEESEAPVISSSPARTPEQEIQLGRGNCGKNANGFRQFSRKHIIRLTTSNWNPDHHPTLAFYFAPAKRGHEPVSTATFFFMPATELLDYHLLENSKYGDVCNTSDRYDTYTCYRFKNEDGFSGCVSAGMCSPNYQKSTGHLLLPMDCTPDSAQPEKDLPGNALLFEHVQQFVADRKIMSLPVTDYLRVLFDWMRRKKQAEANHEVFTETRPEFFRSPREHLVVQFLKYLQANNIPEYLPESILRLFYPPPRIIFDTPMRTSSTPTAGSPSVHTLRTKINPDWIPPTDPATIEVPWGVGRDFDIANYVPAEIPELPPFPIPYWDSWRFIDAVLCAIEELEELEYINPT